MIIQPKIRGFICTTAHPIGCAKRIQEEINFVQNQGVIEGGPKKVLVIGASTGYGMSSRIVSAFGCRAATLGIFFEKAAEVSKKRTASAGWYNSVAFEQKANDAGIYAKSFNGDAYSDEMKQTAIEAIKKDLGKVDLVIYSLAAPRRKHPKTGQMAQSVLKPIGGEISSLNLNLSTNTLETITLEEASQDEIDQTVSVMGGEDWALWIEALAKAEVLEKDFLTVAYSYVGPVITQAVYRNGTIGKAKMHLESTAKEINELLKNINGRALVSANKALVTQSSSAIPVIPLYFVLLNKIMKSKNVHEDCIDQIYRLFASRLYNGGNIPVDNLGLIRMDDLEIRDDVQQEVNECWNQLNSENLTQFADLKGYDQDFLKLFGFGIEGVDYEADVEFDQPLPSSM
jgi:enoyl-[acyl-carrier protein] reductase / trans-2-enoyl-CoA reductase (NAD+)